MKDPKQLTPTQVFQRRDPGVNVKSSQGVNELMTTRVALASILNLDCARVEACARKSADVIPRTRTRARSAIRSLIFRTAQPRTSQLYPGMFPGSPRPGIFPPVQTPQNRRDRFP